MSRGRWLAWCLVLAACQSSAALGGRCALSSECAAPLVCRGGRCRTECIANRDCPIGARCLLIGGTGTCALDDDVCTDSIGCASGLVCVSGACVNACTSLVQCPPDATCDSTSGVAHCVPTASADGGVLDAANHVTIVSIVSGVAANTAGHVAIPPPSTARAGDLVLLLLDRYFETAPVAATIGQGWTSVASGSVDGDAQEIASVTAGASESTNVARYTFPSADMADWTLVVARGASTVRSLSANTGPVPFAFAASTTVPGGIIVDVVASDYPSTCTCAPPNTAYAESSHWHVIPWPTGSAGAPAVMLTCDSAAHTGALAQLGIDP